MKNRKLLAVLTMAMFLGGILLVAGCARTGMQRSAKTGSSMQAVESDIRQIIVQVDATGESMEDLLAPGQFDMQKAFKKYSSNVDKMEDLEKRVYDHADKMRVQGKGYFQEWQTQGDTYSNAQIQGLSERRRADQRAIFVKITEASVGLRGAFKAYMSDIREIQMYLSNDLTSKGVDAIAPIIGKAVNDGAGLKEAVDPVLYAIGQARAELAQAGTK